MVTGVGFLGAGAIIHQGFAVRGLTTAAAVWISAAIGMAAGIGFYALALTGTAVVLIALLVFRHVRTALLQRVQSDRILVEVEVDPDRVRDMLDLVAEHDAVLDSLDCEEEGDLTAVRLHVRRRARHRFAPHSCARSRPTRASPPRTRSAASTSLLRDSQLKTCINQRDPERTKAWSSTSSRRS